MKPGRRRLLKLGLTATAVASISSRGAAGLSNAPRAERAIPDFRQELPNHERITIPMLDGQCPGHVFTPDHNGPWPAAIFFMDGFGIRPNLFDMAQRLADGGYVVLLPDLYYRKGPYEPLDLARIFSSGNVKAAVEQELGEPPDVRRTAKDVGAFLEYLTSRSDVAGAKIGTTGYCMSGGISLTVAGTYPDRIAAAASFHGGNLATDSNESPHLLASRMKGRIYVAGAEKDKSYPPEMAERLERALTVAGVDHRSEIYPGTMHGWTMRDTPVYNHAGAERHWRELFALFDGALR